MEITVEAQSIVQPFSARFFGLNFDWTATDGIMHGRGAASSNDEKMARLFDGVPLPFNRVAGTDSQEFRWKWAIGPAAERRAQKIWPYTPLQIVKFGPVEWVRWCLQRDPDARFVWVPNMHKDTPQDAADLVEFLTGDGSGNPGGGVNWAQRRIELGLPQPVSVAVWELGNEMDHTYESKSFRWEADEYIEKCKVFMAAMRAVDPGARFAAHASTRGEAKWDETVLRVLAPQIDYIVLHCYYAGFSPMPEGKTFAGRWQGHARSKVVEMVRKMHELIKATTGEDRIKILVTEHAMWPPHFKGEEWAATWHRTHALDGILSTAWFWTVLLNQPGVAGANYHSFSSGPWGLAYPDGNQEPYTTAIQEVFARMGRLPAGDVVRTRISPQVDVDSPDEMAVAAVRAGDHLALLVVNPAAERTVRFTFAGNEAYHIESIAAMHGPDLEAFNDMRHQPLRFDALAGFGAAGQPLRAATLPAHSLCIIHLTANPR